MKCTLMLKLALAALFEAALIPRGVVARTLLKRRPTMRIRCAWHRLQIAIVLASVSLIATSAFGQTPPATPGTIESQIEQVMAENAALREQLRKIEEQQKEMLELIRLSDVCLLRKKVVPAVLPLPL